MSDTRFIPGEAELKWHGEYPADIVERVRADIAAELDSLECAADLLFHTVFLGDEESGPTVMVWGEENDDAFHCEYHATTMWVPMHEALP